MQRTNLVTAHNYRKVNNLVGKLLITQDQINKLCALFFFFPRRFSLFRFEVEKKEELDSNDIGMDESIGSFFFFLVSPSLPPAGKL